MPGNFNGTPGPGRTPGTKSKPLTTAQKAEAIALWESGNVTLKDLAARFGKAEETFSRFFAKEGVKKSAKAAEHAEKVKEEVNKAVVDDAAVMAQRIRDTKESHYTMAEGLAKLTWNEIVKANREGKTLASIQANLKSLDLAMGVLKKAREERYAVLGLNEVQESGEGELPDLVIKELTADQIEELKNREFNPKMTPVAADVDAMIEGDAK